MPADVLVSQLNTLFSRFDKLCDSLGVDKIKTIGDAYLAVGGLPGGREDHVAAVAELGLEMVRETSEMPPLEGREWGIRVGIHTGLVVAGVIGTHKFVYDVWGDTVNTASRMESHSLAGRIQISAATRAALGNRFELEPRGLVDIRGKGMMETYFLKP